MFNPNEGMTMTPTDFRAWRKRHFPTQGKAGEVLGACRNTIFNYENGVTPIPYSVTLAMEAIDWRETIDDLVAVLRRHGRV
jgi:DNA-binding XRE family transcriptional regulator